MIMIIILNKNNDNNINKKIKSNKKIRKIY